MSQQYAPVKHDHPAQDSGSPVLTDADEEFLRRLASEDQGLEEPEREIVLGKDGKAVGAEGAEKVPLPASPSPAGDGIAPPPAAVKKTRTEEFKNKGKEYLSYAQSYLPFGKDSVRRQAGGHLHDVAHSVKTGESLQQSTKPSDPKKEETDVANILTKLNLSAVNNKAFAFSQESQKLFARFTLILKDIINGVPTAYSDLELLLTDSDKQLKEMYEKMPPFLQNLIKSLPSKMTATVAPGLAAVMSEKPGNDGKLHAPAQKRSSMPKLKIPALKNLVKGDAVVAMLRSILNFLKLRFPAALTGTNVLLSMAVFLLLFVFWYCHKRGREVRLEKEATATGGKTSVASRGDESDVEASDNAVSEDEEDRAILEAALRRPQPHQVALPPRTESEKELK